MSYITGSVSNFQSASPGLYGNVKEEAIPASLAPSGPAGGALTGTYPNPGLAAIPGVTPVRSVNGAVIGSDMSVPNPVFAFSAAGLLGVLSSATADVRFQGNWYGGNTMFTANVSGAATIQFYFNVVWIVASNPTITVDVDMQQLFTAIAIPLVWSDGGVVSFNTGIFPLVRNNINIQDIVNVSYPAAGICRFVYNAGLASLSCETNTVLTFNLGGAN